MSDDTVVWHEYELDRLVDWVLWFYTEADPDERGPHSPYNIARMRGCAQFLRVIALEAGRTGGDERIEQLCKLVRYVDGAERGMGHDTLLQHSCVAVTALLGSGAPVTEAVWKMARAEHWLEREAVALGLRADDDSALPILEALAADPHPAVRETAREKLEALRELRWWLGVFSRDPLAALSPEQAAALAQPLSVIRDYTNGPDDERTALLPAFSSAVAALPDDSAADLTTRFVRAEPWDAAVPGLLRDVCRRPTAADVIARVLEPTADTLPATEHALRVADVAVSALRDTASAQRAELLAELATRMVGTLIGHDSLPAQQLICAFAELWPPGADTRRVVALVYQLDESAHDTELDELRCVLARALFAIVRSDPETVARELWPLIHMLRRRPELGDGVGPLARALTPAHRLALANKLRASQHDDLRELGQQLAADLDDA